ncbi:MAG: LamG-like jellyroll fold domain-containing protein [Bacteroidota bacterium]
MRKTSNLLWFVNRSKKLKKLMLSTLLLVSFATASQAQGPVSGGLIAQYCLDANTNDALGAKNGTAFGAIPTADRMGAPNMAYEFDGIDDYIDLPDDVWMSGDFTVTGWLRIDTFKKFGRFFEFGNGATNDNVIHSPTPFSPPSTWGTTDGYAIRRQTCGTITHEATNGAAVPVGTSTWIYITVIQRGTVGEIWHNGVLTTGPSTIANAPCSVLRTQNYFGRSPWSHDEYFKGAMDDIRVYNRALSAAEVDTLFNLYNSCDASLITADCSDTCYWKVTGNNILAPGRNILGTLSNDEVRIFTNNTQAGVFTNTGDFGWNTLAPTAKFHVDVTGRSFTDGIRFQGLSAYQDNDVVTVDPMGNLHTRPYLSPVSGNFNTCTTLGMIPKTSVTTGDMDCSQIFDDGTSVGIGTTGPFIYLPGGGAAVGSAPPPFGSIIKLDVNGIARAQTLLTLSDANFKTNVKTLESALDKVLSLNPVEYEWKVQQYPAKNFDNYKHSGFLAQELEKVIPTSVFKDKKGEYAVDYISIIPVLTKAIQEQQTEIEELKTIIKKLNLNSTGQSEINSNDGYLAQNTPNPFTSSTLIKYQLPKGAKKSAIGVYDMNGQEVRLIQLSAESDGFITIQGGELKPGMYLYTLIVDGKYFDSKKMVLTSQ